MTGLRVQALRAADGSAIFFGAFRQIRQHFLPVFSCMLLVNGLTTLLLFQVAENVSSIWFQSALSTACSTVTLIFAVHFVTLASVRRPTWSDLLLHKHPAFQKSTIVALMGLIFIKIVLELIVLVLFDRLTKEAGIDLPATIEALYQQQPVDQQAIQTLLGFALGFGAVHALLAAWSNVAIVLVIRYAIGTTKGLFFSAWMWVKGWRAMLALAGWISLCLFPAAPLFMIALTQQLLLLLLGVFLLLLVASMLILFVGLVVSESTHQSTTEA